MGASANPVGLQGTSVRNCRTGLYEKALPMAMAWNQKLSVAADCGYAFIEMSIDESDERLHRLYESASNRKAFLKNLDSAPIGIETICLSGHRKYSLGSQSEVTRRKARDIMERAIELALEVGVRVIQVAGYDAYYEPSTDGTRSRYLENLCWAAQLAARHCVMLGIENVDPPGLDSISRSLSVVKQIDSPWLQIYGDFGNCLAAGHDVTEEIGAGEGHTVAMHVKDTQRGRFRDVRFGEGAVDFTAAFAALDATSFTGPLVLEMWNEADPDAARIVKQALRWVRDQMPNNGGQRAT